MNSKNDIFNIGQFIAVSADDTDNPYSVEGCVRMDTASCKVHSRPVVRRKARRGGVVHSGGVDKPPCDGLGQRLLAYSLERTHNQPPGNRLAIVIRACGKHPIKTIVGNVLRLLSFAFRGDSKIFTAYPDPNLLRVVVVIRGAGGGVSLGI